MNFVMPIKDKEKIERMRSVLGSQSERNLFLFDLGANTGLRISDLLPLKVKDLKGERTLVYFEKKKDGQCAMPLNSKIRRLIESYVRNKRDDDYLFPSRKGNSYISREQAYRILNKAAKEVGLNNIGTHSLRKTLGYHYYKNTKNIGVLMTMFNHQNETSSLRYMGIDEEEIQKEAEKFSI